MLRSIDSQMFRHSYASVFKGDDNWANIKVPAGQRYAWDAVSTYVKSPPYFDDMNMAPPPLRDVRGARALACSATRSPPTTSPRGNIARNSPAARYLVEQGVAPADFNSYGARRGNHEVMMRARLPTSAAQSAGAGVEGGVTCTCPMANRPPSTTWHALPRGRYAAGGARRPRVWHGSSRDWAAKGTMLLGVKAVIAESFERIHRSNLIGMGVAPLQFLPGQNVASLKLTGREVFEIAGLSRGDADEVSVSAPRHRAKPCNLPLACALTPRRSASTTGTAGSCSTCCASWPQQAAPPDRSRAAGRAPESHTTRRGEYSRCSISMAPSRAVTRCCRTWRVFCCATRRASPGCRACSGVGAFLLRRADRGELKSRFCRRRWAATVAPRWTPGRRSS